MNFFNKIILIGLLLGLSFLWTQFIPISESSYNDLVWSDEFDVDGAPDASKWSYDLADGCPNNCGWGNAELQSYTNRTKNVRVEDDKLKIELRKENERFTSARLVSKGKGDWTYGRFEIRAKLPSALGTWPAIWMLPTDNVYGNWPRSGEIDIMENVGYDPDTIIASAHTFAYNHGIDTHKKAALHVPDCSEEFHVYSLEWNEEKYDVYVDEKLLFTFNNENKSSKEWPFDQRFHLILNLAFGGNWGGKMGVDPSALPVTMVVDYVRVYQ